MRLPQARRAVAGLAAAAALALSGIIATVAPAHAASSVTYDTTGPGSNGATAANTTTLSWTHTVNAGTGRALVAEIAVGASADTGCSVTMKDGTTVMPRLAVKHTNNQTAGFLEVHTLVNPPTGANSISVTVTGCSPKELTGGSESFQGVDQTTPFGTPATNAGASGSASVTTPVPAGTDRVAAFAANGSGITSASSNGKFIANRDNNTGAGNSAGAAPVGTTSSITETWTVASDWWAAIGVPVNGTGTPPPPPSAPTVNTEAATGVTSSAATLHGNVNPNGAATTYQFDYGTTTSYGTSVPSPAGSAGSGTTAVEESAGLSSLTASTTYHYRIEATNATGTTLGGDQTFTTSAAGGGNCTHTWPSDNGQCGPYSYAGISGPPSAQLSNFVVGQNVWSGNTAYHQALTATSPGNWSIVANGNTNWGGVQTYPNSGWFEGDALSADTHLNTSWDVTIPSDITKVAGWAGYDLWFNNWADEVFVVVDATAPSQYNCTGTSFTAGGQDWHFCDFGSERVIKPGTDDNHMRNVAAGSVDMKPILQWLVSNGHLSASSTWTAGSFGFEVCDTHATDTTWAVNNFTWAVS